MTAAASDRHLSKSAIVRCGLALACSHLLALYATARVTIRYLLDGRIDAVHVALAVVAILTGGALSFRQLLNQPTGRRRLYGTTGIILWFAISFALMVIAADSAIPKLILTALWAVGTLWVAWSIWAFSFFRTTQVLIGWVAAGLGAVLLWSLVEVTGLTGDARVEFAWRRSDDQVAELSAGDLHNVAQAGTVLWPGYLGPNRAGDVVDVELDADWALHPPQQLWRVTCGRGWSSFAATDTTLFGQEQLNGTDCVTARSLQTGELIWVASEVAAGFTSGLGGDGPRATPTLHVIKTDGKDMTVLFATGPTGRLSCLNADTGQSIWQVDLAELFPGKNLEHGVCGSPLVAGDLVIACPPTPGGPCMAAFDVIDGSLVWQCASDWRSSYASPALMTIGQRPQIVLHAGPGVVGADPADGTILWQFEWTNEWDNNATQPLQLTDHPNDLVIATGYRGGAVRLSFEIDKDNRITPHEIWKTTSTLKTKFCGLVRFDDVLVGLDNGIMCGVRVDSGERLWKEGRFGHGQILKAGQHLLVVEERGRLNLLKPNAAGHNPLGSKDVLNGKTWNHPVLADSRLILRNDREIVCLQLSLRRTPQGADHLSVE